MKYRKLFFIGLCLHIICAWFSVGYNHPDEHFQIVEFANFKLGQSPASDLPWEYNTKIRSTIQPIIFLGIIKISHFIGIYNPFYISFFCRLMVAIWAWYITYLLSLLLLKYFTNEKSKLIFIFMSQLLWFVPYLNVRFSGENLSALLFLTALYLFLKFDDFPKNKYLIFSIIGVLFGFSFFIRFQMFFAMFGLGFWLILIKKENWKFLIMLIFSAICAIGINVCIDYWFYGEWVFPDTSNSLYL